MDANETALGQAPSAVVNLPTGMAERLVAEAGSIADSVATGAPQASPAVAPLEGAPGLEVSRVFDEASTTEGITLLIETADECVTGHFAQAALNAGGSQAESERFAKMARLNPALKPGTIKGAVAMCRERGWNVDPKHVFYVAVLAWARGIALAASGVKKLGAITKPEAPKPDAPVT